VPVAGHGELESDVLGMQRACEPQPMVITAAPALIAVAGERRDA
jgi:hypothetical protein